ncbi:MAG TPA: hypothetical protein VM600_01830, partial [Actinomycetota bacterium]|nr:hypothetical protein [Actinomycetota bacterium]
MHTQDTAVLARVIPLEHKRRARKVSRRSSVMKSSGLRGIVALWFGILIVGAASLLAAVTTVALRAGAVGTAGLIALGAAAAW